MAVFIDMHTDYTKRLDTSNEMFVSRRRVFTQNKRVELIKRINRALEAREWGWADLARALNMSEQRLTNWKSRGVPASQVRNIEKAIGLPRYALDSDEYETDEIAMAVAEFTFVFRHSDDRMRGVLLGAIAGAKPYISKEAGIKSVLSLPDKRKKA